MLAHLTLNQAQHLECTFFYFTVFPSTIYSCSFLLSILFSPPQRNRRRLYVRSSFYFAILFDSMYMSFEPNLSRKLRGQIDGNYQLNINKCCGIEQNLLYWLWACTECDLSLYRASVLNRIFMTNLENLLSNSVHIKLVNKSVRKWITLERVSVGVCDVIVTCFVCLDSFALVHVTLKTLKYSPFNSFFFLLDSDNCFLVQFLSFPFFYNVCQLVKLLRIFELTKKNDDDRNSVCVRLTFIVLPLNK